MRAASVVLVLVVATFLAVSCSDYYKDKEDCLFAGKYLNDGTPVVVYQEKDSTKTEKIYWLEDWTKFPRQFDSRFPNGAVYCRGTDRRFVIVNPCTAKVIQWGYGYVKLLFPAMGNGKYVHPAGPYQEKHGIKMPAPDSTKTAIWVWQPNPKGWEAGQLIVQ